MNINTSQRGAVSFKRSASGNSGLNIKNSYVGDYVRQRTQQKNSYNKYCSGAVSEEESASSLREMMYEKRRKDKNEDFYSRFAQNSYNYAESLRASRTKNQQTKSKVKKLRYSFKAISSQIMKCKTSVTARQVAGKAKREVVRLRQKKLSAQYDPEEVQIALTHAMKIARVAKKKVKHLLEEEMVKVTGGPCAGELEEREDGKGLGDKEKAEDAIAAMENGMSGKDAAEMQQRRAMSSQEQAKYMQAQMEQMQDMMQAQMEQMQAQMEQMAAEMQYAMEVAREEMQASMEDMMSDFMDEMAQSMEKFLEESGLSDLLDDIMGGFDREMDPADFHMMKLKHRAKELKEIAEADAEYLKAVFDRLERMKDSAVQNMLGSSDNNAASFACISAGGGIAVPVNTESAAEIVQESAGIESAAFSSAGVSVSAPVMVGGSVDVSL